MRVCGSRRKEVEKLAGENCEALGWWGWLYKGTEGVTGVIRSGCFFPNPPPAAPRPVFFFCLFVYL